jgi:hypothetical protein
MSDPSGATNGDWDPEDEVIALCGGDYQPGPRDACPDPLHDYPLPSGYNDAAEAAGRRFRKGWSQTKCPTCHVYGWRPGQPTGDACDAPTPHTPTELGTGAYGDPETPEQGPW